MRNLFPTLWAFAVYSVTLKGSNDSITGRHKDRHNLRVISFCWLESSAYSTHQINW